jgi:AcrR family transcriptional regulator
VRDTRTRLIEEAERLFALEGIDRPSLAQISSAAGQLNTNAVQYHFGTRERLVFAILEHRLPGIDRRRAELLEQTPPFGDPMRIRALIEALVRPLAEVCSEPWGASYVRFLGRLNQWPGVAGIPKDVSVSAVHQHFVFELLEVELRDVAREVLALRIAVAKRLWVDAVVVVTSAEPNDRELAIAVAVDMLVGAVTESRTATDSSSSSYAMGRSTERRDVPGHEQGDDA